VPRAEAPTREEGRGFWGELGADYVDTYVGLDRRFGAVYTRAAEALGAAAGVEAGQTVVDLGCGTGTSMAVIARAVGAEGQVLGIDRNAAMLARARERFAGRPEIDCVDGDMADLARIVDAAGLTGRVDGVLSSFSYFYCYDFHLALQRDIRAVLRPGGWLSFNIGTFLSPVSWNGVTYNGFTELYLQTLDELLREAGHADGAERFERHVNPLFNDWDLSVLHDTGYRRIEGAPWSLPMTPSQVYRYSIDGFHRWGLGFGSRTLMAMPLAERLGWLERALSRCADDLDATGERSHILNVVAVK
jgi:ubiquinone/menaquinone biosynthesis C-methylase UbiE